MQLGLQKRALALLTRYEREWVSMRRLHDSFNQDGFYDVLADASISVNL